MSVSALKWISSARKLMERAERAHYFCCFNCHWHFYSFELHNNDFSWRIFSLISWLILEWTKKNQVLPLSKTESCGCHEREILQGAVRCIQYISTIVSGRETHCSAGMSKALAWCSKQATFLPEQVHGRHVMEMEIPFVLVEKPTWGIHFRLRAQS